MKLSDFKNATIVVLDNELFHVVVDKPNHRILQTKLLDSSVTRQDCTAICEQMEKEYCTLGDDTESSYPGGVVLAKLLNDRLNRKCLRFLKLFTCKFYSA